MIINNRNLKPFKTNDVKYSMNGMKNKLNFCNFEYNNYVYTSNTKRNFN